jgi:hypothetical protein
MDLEGMLTKDEVHIKTTGYRLHGELVREK